jgi:hypothetical protein
VPLIVVAFFSPILFTGLYGDDRVLAVINYRNSASLMAISNSIGEFIYGWLENGRFAPIGAILSVTFFRFFDFNHYAGYHAIQLVAISLSCMLFAWRLVEGNTEKIVAVLLLCAMSSNYWHYHDPYVSYNLLMPAFTLMFLGAIILFKLYLETGIASHGIASLILYLMTLSTYEIAYPLILVFFVQLIMIYPKYKKIWIALVILLVAMVGFQLWLRIQANEIVYEGLTLKLSPLTVIHTFILQAFSSIPLAQQIGSIILRIINRFNGIPVDTALTLTIFTGITVFTVFALFRFLKNRSKENSWLIIGLIIWLAPPLVIAISAKYQGELRWGIGYLPRYLQNFGLVLVTVAIAGKALTKRGGLTILTYLLAINFFLNVRTIRKMNRDFSAARLMYNVVEDSYLLSKIGCRHLFVINSYMYSCQQYQPINPSVEVHDGDIPLEGDHVLLIHPDNAGSEWAILGVYQKGMVHEPRLIRGIRRNEQTVSEEMTRFKEWVIFKQGGVDVNYNEIVEAVNSGKDYCLWAWVIKSPGS